MKEFDKMDVEAIAKAIEADAGRSLPSLRRSLRDVKEKRFARVHTPAQMLARSARARTGLTQQDFAKRIATPVATLRDWEQGRFDPPGAVVCLLTLLEKQPELLNDLA
ncbi:MAG: helix-turn-helix domain-containing protein [Burkholderiaceae bacterium]|jgi:putative transcriptional regulator|nr:helix-turn-helix domain-containing protein [Burkholderiaceae bacterium]